MPNDRKDDLNWLYGRERRAPESEPTQVIGPAGRGDGGPPTADYPPVGAGLYRPDGTEAQAPHRAATPSRPTDRPLPPLPDPRSIQPAPRAADAGAPPTGPPAGPGGPGGPGSPGAPGARARGPKRKRPVRRTLGVLGVLLVLMLVWLVAVPVYAWSRIARVDAAPSGDRPAGQPGTAILLVGSDSREGLTKAERKKLGTGSTGGQRTDTIMILYVPPGGKPALISVPRDSYLPIPGQGSNKINAAYAFGGPELLVQTVEQSTGLRMDAYTEIGFGGFVNVIDAVGGIEMCLPDAIKDRDSHLDLPKGCQDLNGTDALGYVRMRKADPLGDLGRVQRQREMVAAVGKKALSPATVVNPVRYWQLSTSGADAVAIGRDTTFLEAVAMLRGMRAVSSGGGLTLTVPVSNPGASTPVGSAVLWDEAKAKDMFGDIARGDTSGLAKYAK